MTTKNQNRKDLNILLKQKMQEKKFAKILLLFYIVGSQMVGPDPQVGRQKFLKGRRMKVNLAYNWVE